VPDDVTKVDPLSNSGRAKLRDLVAQLDEACDERTNVQATFAGLYREAREAGFDVKALKAVIKRRGEDKAKREELEATVELYESVVARSGT
jgi:uncharacterized protein (UPF0335 family)